MSAPRSRNKMLHGVALLMSLFLIASPAEARSHRYRRHHNNVPGPLRALVAAHTVVHAAVFNAPRILAAPVRVAYQTSVRSHERIFQGEQVDESDVDQAPETDAYFTSRTRRQQPPRGENSIDYDDYDDAPRRAQASDDSDFNRAQPSVSGNRAVLRSGVAIAPLNAPSSVKSAIQAANTLRRKPYVWGGGHGSFNDRGYDCSGTVSFALHHAGVLATPLPSSEFMRYGAGGRGRWITIYSRPGHTFAVIAGLRLDTTDFAIGGNVGPRWHADGRDTYGYVARHPVGL